MLAKSRKISTLATKTLVAVSAIALFWPSFLHAGNSASTTAVAKAKVLKSIAIVKVNDLDFGTGYTGDAAKVIAPGGTGSASFTVSGEKNTAYTITLPASVTMMNTTTGGTTANDQLLVNAFSSNPSGTGLLSATGSQTLNVGATRAAIPSTQNSGDYSGTFTVQVIY